MLAAEGLVESSAARSPSTRVGRVLQEPRRVAGVGRPMSRGCEPDCRLGCKLGERLIEREVSGEIRILWSTKGTASGLKKRTDVQPALQLL